MGSRRIARGAPPDAQRKHLKATPTRAALGSSSSRSRTRRHESERIGLRTPERRKTPDALSKSRGGSTGQGDGRGYYCRSATCRSDLYLLDRHELGIWATRSRRSRRGWPAGWEFLRFATVCRRSVSIRQQRDSGPNANMDCQRRRLGERGQPKSSRVTAQSTDGSEFIQSGFEESRRPHPVRVHVVEIDRVI